MSQVRNVPRKWHPGSIVFTVTSFLKDRNSEVCKRTKMTRAPCRRRNGEEAVPRSEKFGELTTADHKVFNEGSESRNGHRYAVRGFQETLKRSLVVFGLLAIRRLASRRTPASRTHPLPADTFSVPTITDCYAWHLFGPYLGLTVH